MLLIGSKLPSFSAPTITDGEISTITDADLLGSYTLIFFYGLDFSFVCPGEIHSLQNALPEFEKRNTRVIAVSVDSIYTHAKWLATPQSLAGIQGTKFTLVSDMSHKLSKALNVYDDEQGFSLRASFITDEENIVQYASANSFAFGRSIKELLRNIDAIQSIKSGTEQFCPVNWKMETKPR